MSKKIIALQEQLDMHRAMCLGKYAEVLPLDINHAIQTLGKKNKRGILEVEGLTAVRDGAIQRNMVLRQGNRTNTEAKATDFAWFTTEYAAAMFARNRRAERFAKQLAAMDAKIEELSRTDKMLTAIGEAVNYVVEGVTKTPADRAEETSSKRASTAKPLDPAPARAEGMEPPATPDAPWPDDKAPAPEGNTLTGWNGVIEENAKRAEPEAPKAPERKPKATAKKAPATPVAKKGEKAPTAAAGKPKAPAKAPAKATPKKATAAA